MNDDDMLAVSNLGRFNRLPDLIPRPTIGLDPLGRIDMNMLTCTATADVSINPNGFIYTQGSDIDVQLGVSKRIKELIQMAHTMAPKGRSDDFYEGLSHALSCMEQQV